MRLVDKDAIYASIGASGNCNKCPQDAYQCQYYREWCRMDFCERIDDVPEVDAIPMKELEDLYKEMRQADGGDTWLCFDGNEYSTDTGYAFEGIEIFLDAVRRRYGRKDDEND